MLLPNDWNTRLMFAFCRAKPIWMPKKPMLMRHRPRNDRRGFSMVMLSPLPEGKARHALRGNGAAYE